MLHNLHCVIYFVSMKVYIQNLLLQQQIRVIIIIITVNTLLLATVVNIIQEVVHTKRSALLLCTCHYTWHYTNLLIRIE